MNLFVSPFLVFFLNVHIWFLLAAAATSSLVLLVPSITWELLNVKLIVFCGLQKLLFFWEFSCLADRSPSMPTIGQCVPLNEFPTRYYT